MRRVVLRVAPAALAVVVAAALGVTLRAALPGAAAPPAGAAVLVVLAVAPCVAASFHDAVPRVSAGAVRAGTAFALAGLTAAVAVLAAGAPAASVAAALVPAGAAALALGSATLSRSLGAEPGTATLLGAGLCAAFAGSLFVADPLIEWNGADEASPRRAALVYRTSPVAAALSGVGIDWQRTRLLYDGPSGAGGGLSLVGQYYPVDPAPPAWGLGVCGLGLGIFFAGLGARVRRGSSAS